MWDLREFYVMSARLNRISGHAVSARELVLEKHTWSQKRYQKTQHLRLDLGRIKQDKGPSEYMREWLVSGARALWHSW